MWLATCGYAIGMTTQPDDVTPDAIPDAVATGESPKTPVIALGAMVGIIALLFVIALAAAALAYWLA